MTQIFGYKLSAEDGSESRWMFINERFQRLVLPLRLKNGATLQFDGFGDEIIAWAAPRELTVERLVFDFDPIAMAFTREE